MCTGPTLEEQKRCIAVMLRRAAWALEERPDRSRARRAPAGCLPGEPELRLPTRPDESDNEHLPPMMDAWKNVDGERPLPSRHMDTEEVGISVDEDWPPPCMASTEKDRVQVLPVQVPVFVPGEPKPDLETLAAGLGLGISLAIAAQKVSKRKS